VKSGAASPGFNAAHAAVVKRARQRERNRVDGFTGRILLLRARLAAKTKADRPLRRQHNALHDPINDGRLEDGFKLFL
jgi:hypothetical protein